MDIAGKPEGSELVEKRHTEATRSGEPVNLFVREVQALEKSSACSRPAATRNPRRGGNLRTKNSKTAVLVSP